MPNMPSTRRLKALGILVLLFVLITLYVTSAARQTRESGFYTKTQDALARQRAAKEASLGSKDSAPDFDPDSDAVARRVREAEEQAKKAADKKAEEFHGEDVVKDKKKEKEYLDRKMEKEAAAKAKVGSQDVVKGKEDGKQQAPETEEEHQIKDELNSILKRSPIIIFSKSYCPYSRKAKDILLTKYKITPPPFVVELDEHALGPQLQAELGSITGRKTVPNILINGKSIGGGDDVQQLHEDNKLIATVKDLIGKRVEISAAPSVEQKEASS